MKSFIILYRTPSSNPLDEPFDFPCNAETLDDAEDLFFASFPDCNIVWVHEGSKNSSRQTALDDYNGW